MTTLNEQIDSLTETVLSGARGLDDALGILDAWLGEHALALSPAERGAFSAALDADSTDDNRSLIDSVLRLHAARLLYRYDARQVAPPPPPRTPPGVYAESREAFSEALGRSEEAINESRIDIAIANAHHLLGDIHANRRWLNTALERLPALAAIDLVALAQDIPPMPPPRLTLWQRAGLKLMGVSLDRLAQRSRDDLATLARMQADQVILLAHLLGASFETIHERQRARRAFRIAAHLIVRHDGMLVDDAVQLLDIAASLGLFEVEAAQIVARQARTLCATQGDADGLARSEAFLEQLRA
jgi:hypothetical protein